jgi:hypothetical protein
MRTFRPFAWARALAPVALCLYFASQATPQAATDGHGRQIQSGMGGRMTFVGEQYGQAVWSNFPVSDVPRPGLTLGSLTPAQHLAATPWMFEYGGYHLALNITIAGERGVLTPTLTGAQPSIYTSNGKTVRALAQENDKAFALLNSLDETERKQAILN